MTEKILIAALQGSATARQVYLFLHPRLKYEWTVPTLCRMAKMLSDGPFLAAWDDLALPNGSRFNVIVVKAAAP